MKTEAAGMIQECRFFSFGAISTSIWPAATRGVCFFASDTTVVGEADGGTTTVSLAWDTGAAKTIKVAAIIAIAGVKKLETWLCLIGITSQWYLT